MFSLRKNEYQAVYVAGEKQNRRRAGILWRLVQVARAGRARSEATAHDQTGAVVAVQVWQDRQVIGADHSGRIWVHVAVLRMSL